MDSAGIWSAPLNLGEQLLVLPGAPLTISNIALAYDCPFENHRTTVTLLVEDATIEIGSFLPGRIEQIHTAISLVPGKQYTFRALGGNSVFLTGHFQRDYYGEITQTKVRRLCPMPIREASESSLPSTQPTAMAKKPQAKPGPSTTKKRKVKGD